MRKTDEELIAAYLSGDEHAFASLVKRHLKAVYSFAARSTKSDAEDIVQNVFLKVWKNLGKFNPDEAKFKTWLMRITRNTVIDNLRKKKSFVFSELENRDEGNPLLDTPDSEPLPDELVARDKDAHQLTEAVQRLSPIFREVILLRYMSQMTFEEIGTVLGQSPNTVRSRHRRGLGKLKESLASLHQRAP